MKYICIKELPDYIIDHYFLIKQDVKDYKPGRIFSKKNNIIYLLENVPKDYFNIKDYILTIAEYREYRINKILND